MEKATPPRRLRCGGSAVSLATSRCASARRVGSGALAATSCAVHRSASPPDDWDPGERVRAPAGRLRLADGPLWVAAAGYARRPLAARRSPRLPRRTRARETGRTTHTNSGEDHQKAAKCEMIVADNVTCDRGRDRGCRSRRTGSGTLAGSRLRRRLVGDGENHCAHVGTCMGHDRRMVVAARVAERAGRWFDGNTSTGHDAEGERSASEDHRTTRPASAGRRRTPVGPGTPLAT